MDLGTLANLGEFVGGTFVVISLVYLAYQVRQNTHSLLSENYGRLLDRMSTLQARLAADAELNRIVIVGAQAPGALTRAERVRFSWALYELVGAGEFMFHHAQEGALSQEVWKRWETTLRWWLCHPGMRAWWKAKPTPFSTSFEAFVDDTILTQSFDPDALQRWEGFVAGRGLAGSPESGSALDAGPARRP